MRWPRLALILALAATALSGCATYTERTSPCVCDWVPVSAAKLVTV